MKTEAFEVARLQEFAQSAFQAVGVRPEHAAITAQRLIEADLRGRTGHGLIRLRPFLDRVIAGGIKVDPLIGLVRETAATGLVDGDNGLGPVVVTYAVEVAARKARAHGVAWVGTVNSNHAGAAGVYTELIMRHGLIGLYFAVAAGNTMPPWGGVERMLGTNPLAVSIPAGEEIPFQLDIATTVASHGSIRVRQLQGEELPVGWVVDTNGDPITDPARAGEGFLVPIGGHKGAGLNLAIGLLAGVLNGAAFGRDVVELGSALEKPTNTGQAIIALDPQVFRDDFSEHMDRTLREFRASASDGDGPLRLSGERAADLTTTQLETGIKLPARLLDDLRLLADELDLTDRLSDVP